jgi:hypothetical protein
VAARKATSQVYMAIPTNATLTWGTTQPLTRRDLNERRLPETASCAYATGMGAKRPTGSGRKPKVSFLGSESGNRTCVQRARS